MPDTGLVSGRTSINVAGANEDWLTPENVFLSDDSRATSQPGKAGISDDLRVTDFPFGIPSGATIDGIEVLVERSVDISGPLQDSIVELWDGTAQVGDDKGSATTWPTTDTVRTYGGATDTWNAGLTRDQISSPGFGMAIAVAQGDDPNQDARIDHIQMRIYYTQPASDDQNKNSIFFSRMGGKRLGTVSNRRPQWPHTLNKDSWAAQGLVAWYPFPPFKDATSLGPRYQQTLMNNGSIAWVSDPEMGLVPHWAGPTGTTEFFEFDSAVFTATPFSIAAWVRNDAAALGNDFCIAQVGDKDVAQHYFRLGSEDLTGDRVRAAVAAGGAQASADTTTAFSLNEWFHAVGSFDSSTSRSSWMNASGKTTNTESRTVSGADRTSIGIEGDSSPGDSWEGDMADVRFYNKVMTDEFVDYLFQPWSRWDLYYELGKVFYSFPGDGQPTRPILTKPLRARYA